MKSVPEQPFRLSADDAPAVAVLTEIRRRLASIQDSLGCGADGVSRALDKLNALLREIDAALTSTEPLPARNGRPPLAADGSWRTLAERAECLKADYPDLPYLAIAMRLGLDERTLRHYRALLRRQAAQAAEAES